MISEKYNDRPQALEGKLSEEQIKNSNKLSILGKTKLPKAIDKKVVLKRL